MLAEESNEQYRRLNLFSQVNRLAVGIHNSNPKNNDMAAIDLNDPEVLNFLKAMAEHEVRYMLVGAFAVAFHGHVRATTDLDIWVSNDEANISKLKNVFTNNGVAGLDQLRYFDLVPGFTQFAVGDSGFVVEPLKYLKAFKEEDFDTCYNRAVSGEYKGVRFKVISRIDLLKEKQAGGRGKDLDDLENLKSKI